MTFISYAQNYEDVMLARALKHVEQGFYIDVGAQDPLIDSVTKIFYDRGWRGINIEPVGTWFQKLLAERPEDYNLKLTAASEAGVVTFYEVVETGLSTMDAELATKHAEAGFEVREYEVPARRLDAICDDLQVTDIHFLKIDVEGAEGLVLAGIDLTRIRPWIILIEATEPNSTVPTHGKWEELLTTSQYVFVHSDGLNRYYVPREREGHLKEALSTPPNYFDQFIRYAEWQAGQRVQQMEAEVGEVRRRLQELEGELVRSRSQGERVQALEKELTEAREQMNAQRQDLMISQARGQWLESEWNASKAKIEELNDPDYFYRFIQYSEWRTGEKVRQLELEVADAHHRLQEMDDLLTASQSRAQWLENEWSAAKAKVDELNQQCHHWWTMADGVTRELQTVYASRSWRLGELLRRMKRLMIQCPHLFTTGMDILVSVLSRLTRYIWQQAVASVHHHPGIKTAVSDLLTRFPALKARLKPFTRAHERMPLPIDPIQSSISDTPGESSLTPRADRIYTQLLVAIKKTKGED